MILYKCDWCGELIDQELQGEHVVVEIDTKGGTDVPPNTIAVDLHPTCYGDWIGNALKAKRHIDGRDEV